MNIQKKAIDLTDLAIGILILGILVSIGASIMLNIRDSRITSLNTEEITSESIIPSNTGTAFSKQYFKSITECYNGTNRIPVVQSGNYTITQSGANGIITNTSSTYARLDGGNSAWLCNYTTYNITRADYVLPNKTAIGLAEYGNWFKILVIVGVSAVILALIFMAFGKGSQGEAGVGGSY